MNTLPFTNEDLESLFSDKPADESVRKIAGAFLQIPKAGIFPPHERGYNTDKFLVWRSGQRIIIFNKKENLYRVIFMDTDSMEPKRLYPITIVFEHGFLANTVNVTADRVTWGKPHRKARNPQWQEDCPTGWGAIALTFVVAGIVAVVLLLAN